MPAVQPRIANNISLFIPRVFANINKNRIVHIFKKFNIGIVDHIDLVSKMDKNGTTYNNAYIHFKTWFQNAYTLELQDKILNPDKEARIVYDDPYYWVVLANTGSYHQPGAPKKKINIDPPSNNIHDNISEITHDNGPSNINCELVSIDYVVSLEKANKELTQKCALVESSVAYWMDLYNNLRSQYDDDNIYTKAPQETTPLTMEDLTCDQILKPKLKRS